jgi:hypothetical protein
MELVVSKAQRKRNKRAKNIARRQEAYEQTWAYYNWQRVEAGKLAKKFRQNRWASQNA